jgi:hypothetical protein
MGNRVVVKPHPQEGTELVSIRPVRRGGKPHYMGSVMLSNVVVNTDSLEGDMLEEFTEARELGTDALKHLTRVYLDAKGWHKLVKTGKKFTRHAVTGQAAAAYVCGTEVYVRL